MNAKIRTSNNICGLHYGLYSVEHAHNYDSYGVLLSVWLSLKHSNGVEPRYH